jgi:hypothetical protein
LAQPHWRRAQAQAETDDRKQIEKEDELSDLAQLGKRDRQHERIEHRGEQHQLSCVEWPKSTGKSERTEVVGDVGQANQFG